MWCNLDFLRSFTFLGRGPHFIFHFRALKCLVAPLPLIIVIFFFSQMRLVLDSVCVHFFVCLFVYFLLFTFFFFPFVYICIATNGYNLIYEWIDVLFAKSSSLLLFPLFPRDQKSMFRSCFRFFVYCSP